MARLWVPTGISAVAREAAKPDDKRTGKQRNSSRTWVYRALVDTPPPNKKIVVPKTTIFTDRKNVTIALKNGAWAAARDPFHNNALNGGSGGAF